VRVTIAESHLLSRIMRRRRRLQQFYGGNRPRRRGFQVEIFYQ